MTIEEIQIDIAAHTPFHYQELNTLAHFAEINGDESLEYVKTFANKGYNQSFIEAKEALTTLGNVGISASDFAHAISQMLEGMNEADGHFYDMLEEVRIKSKWAKPCMADGTPIVDAPPIEKL